MARKPAAAPSREAPTRKREAPTRKTDPTEPQHRWDRPIQAPGHTQVDFEERVDFRRLHDYRVGRVRRRTPSKSGFPDCRAMARASSDAWLNLRTSNR